MNTTMFLPKEIKVGFKEKSDTYSKKLAYVIYFDEKGVLRKENSFESWRQHDMEPERYMNEPMSGFVLNKKAGGYATGWNHRQTYVRVYDPRGFEIEISIENLLYILDNTSSIIGKGLEGEFVYAWQGKNLVLVPVNAPEYMEMKKLNELRHQDTVIKTKDLKVGATYLTRDNVEMVFLGRFNKYEHDYATYQPEMKPKKFLYFARPNNSVLAGRSHRHGTFSTIIRKFVKVIDENPHSELEEMLQELEDKRHYSPIDHRRTVREAVSLEQFLLDMDGFKRHYTAENGKQYHIAYRFDGQEKTFYFEGEYQEETLKFHWLDDRKMKKEIKNCYNKELYEPKTIEDVFHILKPHITHFYQENGRLAVSAYVAWQEHECVMRTND